MIEIYTDGGCSVKTTKQGCWAFVVVKDDELVYEQFGVVDNTTNGHMEVMAMEKALEYALDYCMNYSEEVIIKSDSQYCVNSYNTWTTGWENKGWKKSNGQPVLHQEHWKNMHTLRHGRIKVEWVRGHNGDKWNEYTDKLTHNRK